MLLAISQVQICKSILAPAALAFLLLPSFGNAQSFTISTVAGDGIQGYTGDNIPALQAELWAFSGIGLDRAANILVADTGNCRIRKVANGVITTVAGNGTCGFAGDASPAISAQLSYPRSVAMDAAGNMYIADTGNARVRKVDINGMITTIAGDGTLNYSGDGGPASLAELYDPWSIAADSAGNVFVVDRSNQRVRKIGTDGNINTVAGNGQQAYAGDGGSATAASLYVPDGVALDSAGNIYIVEAQSASVRKVNLQGIIQTVAGLGNGFGFGGDGGPATAAKLNDPQGVTVDLAGNIFIADEDNQRIREVTTDGIIHTVAGNGKQSFSGDGGPSTNSALFLPEGVVAAPGGTVYFVDSGNHRVRALTPTSIQPSSPCATNGAAGASVNDVQVMINEALGDAPPSDDPNGDGVSNVVDVEMVANAAIGKGCSVPNQFPAFFPLIPPSRSVAARPRNAIDLGAIDNLSAAAYGFKHEPGIAGQAIGSRRVDRTSAVHAQFFHEGTSTDLGTLGGVSSEALDVSRNSQIVGWAMTADGARHAFLWTAGTMVDLNAIASAGDGVVFVRAVGIDDMGHILAHGSNGHAYIVAAPTHNCGAVDRSLTVTAQ